MEVISTREFRFSELKGVGRVLRKGEENMGKSVERFRGVRQRQWGSWVSEIRHPLTKRRVWLGTYPSAKDAAIAYNEASRFLFGATTNTNLAFHHHHYREHVNDDDSIGGGECGSRFSPALKEKLRLCSVEYQQQCLFNEANILLHPHPLTMNDTNICQTTSKNLDPRGPPPSQLSYNVKGRYVISKTLHGVANNDNANVNMQNMTQCNGLLTQDYNGWAKVVASSHSHSHCVEEESPNNSQGDDHKGCLINVGDDSISYSSNIMNINNSIIGNAQEVRYEEDWISKEMIEELLNSSFIM